MRFFGTTFLFVSVFFGTTFLFVSVFFGTTFLPLSVFFKRLSAAKVLLFFDMCKYNQRFLDKSRKTIDKKICTLDAKNIYIERTKAERGS